MSANHARQWQSNYAERVPKKQIAIKVKRQSWITKGEKLLYSITGLVLLAACVFLISYSSSADSLNREVQTIEKSIQVQQVENEGLLFEKKELQSPDRIIRIARENGLKIQDTKVKQATAFDN